MSFSGMQRRRFLAGSVAVCLAAAWGMTGPREAAAETGRPPTIVLIFADDLGWKDVSYQGSRRCQTPVLDRLAAEGMVFTDAYATAGNCAPSRACLLAGGYTPRHGVYAVGRTDRGPKKSQRLEPVPNRDGLAEEVVTLAEALRAGGYATGHFGKWHLAGKEGSLPTRQGFDESFNSFGDGELPEGLQTNRPGPPEDPKGVFALTRAACDFLERHRDQPSFCYLAHHAIHTPLQARPESRAAANVAGGGGMYAACTRDLDDSVGLLLERLDALGLAENTLLVFTSDNGATQASPQEPLRGSKGGYYEGGIREPLIVRWPGVVAPGSRSSVPVTNLDLYPTFLAAAGLAPPEGALLDGESLLPLLRQQGALAREAIFWHFPGYLDRPVIRGRPRDVRDGFRTRPVSVIRKGDWKLHLFHEEWLLDGGRMGLPDNAAVELYNLARDIGEREDLAAAEPARREALLGDLLAWIDSVSAVMPTPRTRVSN
jgi:arylsulfatase A-like enzyme